MSELFLNLPSDEQIALIRNAGNQLDIPDMIIEKDFWICWILQKLFELPEKMVFKGGTSLSKVFGLIKRFSEDCDITIDYRNFRDEFNFDNIPRTQLKKITGELKTHMREYIASTILPYLKKQALKEFSDQKFEFQLSDDGEQLYFFYPSILDKPYEYLRDHVLIEFGIRNSTEPNEPYSVKPFLANVVGPNIILPCPRLTTLSPLKTFWEKATLIHVECHRQRVTATPERYSRHWYDLYMLNSSKMGEQAIQNTDILHSVIKYKKAFFNSSYANYDSCLAGKFRLIPSEQSLKVFEQDFSKMINSGMFIGEAPSFEEIMNNLKELEVIINKRF